jgi:hypothetical protein
MFILKFFAFSIFPFSVCFVIEFDQTSSSEYSSECFFETLYIPALRLLLRIEINNNLKFINNSAYIFNDGGNESLVTSIIDLRQDLLRMSAKVIVRLPENDQDQSYGREVFKTSVDIAKFVKGIGLSNFFAKTVMDTFKEWINLDMNFPIKKV